MTCFKNSLSKGLQFRSFYIKQIFFLFSPAYTRTLVARLPTTAIEKEKKEKKHSAADNSNGMQFTEAELLICVLSIT